MEVADRYLSAIEDGRRHLIDALAGVQQYRTACLAAAYSGDWVAEPPVETPLDDIAHVQSGLAKGRTNGVVLTEVPYVRTANVQAGFLDLDVIKTLPVTPEQREKHRLQHNDVLVLEGGDADKVGRGWLWQSELGECLHQNHVFAVRTNAARLLPRYLAYFLNSPQGRRYFLSCAKQTVNLASINKKQLKALPVPVPRLEAQQFIVDRLDQQLGGADTYERHLRKQLAAADALERSVLAEAINGRLVTRPASSSVAASALLEELQTARSVALLEATEARKKRRAVPVGR